jgi:hypothetical protein
MRASQPASDGYAERGGIIIERLGDIETGHRELLKWIEQWISR